ncbi:MAG: hypothetical protein DVB28_001133, partial [Verrucomicrobia bacterium]
LLRQAGYTEVVRFEGGRRSNVPLPALTTAEGGA